MRLMLRQVDRVVAAVSIALAVVGCVWLGALALLVGADVVGRGFGNPVTGTVQLASTSVVAIAFLLMPYTLRRRGHVRSSIVRDRLPRLVGRGVDVLTYALGVVVFAMIVVASWELAVEAWRSGEYSGEGALRVPEYPTRGVVAISAGAMVLECALALVHSLLASEDEVAEGEASEGEVSGV